MQHCLHHFLVVCSLFLLSSELVADSRTSCVVFEDQQLVSPKPKVQELAGWHLAVSGTSLAVGVGNGLDRVGAERVELYELSDGQWSLAQTITPHDPKSYAVFSGSLSLDGDTLAVGAWGDDTIDQYSGAAYVFRRKGGRWGEEQKLVAADGALLDEFGQSIDVDGDVLIVGAPYRDDDGAAYIYRFDGSQWVEEQILSFDDGTLGSSFGYDVSIQGDVAAVSALNTIYQGGWPVADDGRVYLYRFDGAQWNLEATFDQTVDMDSGGYGWVVDLDGDRLAVSAPYASIGPDWAGAVYLYEWTGREWQPHSTVWGTPPIGGFGWSMDLCGDRLLVGDIGEDACYQFEFAVAKWKQSAELKESDGKTSELGKAVALGSEHALAGAPGASPGGVFISGAVYVYTLPACPDTPDTPADLNADGAVDGADLGLLLSAWGEGDSSADLNGDTTVDGADLGLLLSAWTV